MLMAGIILLSIGSPIGAWAFMCDALPRAARPKLSRGPLPLMLAGLVSLAGITLLFILKWYAGVAGIACAIIGFNVLAFVWSHIYRRLAP